MDPDEQLDFQEIEVLCPHCGSRDCREIGWLRKHHEVVCISCGRNVALDRDLIVCAIQDMERALKELDPCPPPPPCRQH